MQEKGPGGADFGVFMFIYVKQQISVSIVENLCPALSIRAHSRVAVAAILTILWYTIL